MRAKGEMCRTMAENDMLESPRPGRQMRAGVPGERGGPAARRWRERVPRGMREEVVSWFQLMGEDMAF